MPTRRGFCPAALGFALLGACDHARAPSSAPSAPTPNGSEPALISPAVASASPTVASSASGASVATTAPSAVGATPATHATPMPSAWRATPSPLEATNPSTASPDVAEVNLWATRAGVREDLPLWVSVALPLVGDVNTSIEIDYERGEQPKAATVTAIQDGFLDDSVRGQKTVLTFVREPCPACGSSSAPWSLRSVEVTQRCWPGRGHQDYSKALCN